MIIHHAFEDIFILFALNIQSLSSLQESELERHVCHMTSGPIVALCLQRENAVGRLLEVLGPSDPRAARKQSQFFLRGSFGEDSIQNAFYGTFTKTWSILVRILLKRRLLIVAYLYYFLQRFSLMLVEVEVSRWNRMNASANIFGYLRVAFENLRKCSEDLRASKSCSESSRRFCAKQ